MNNESQSNVNETAASFEDNFELLALLIGGEDDEKADQSQIKELQGRSEQEHVPRPIERMIGRDEAVLSFAQQRLWFLNQLDPDSPFYNLSTAFRLTGRLDDVILERSLNELVRRHGSLRTSFHVVGGSPVQRVQKHVEFKINRVQVEGTSDEKWQKVLEYARTEVQKPFDVCQSPLLRVTTIELDDEDHVLLLCLHHIVSDGWSLGVMAQEIVTLYQCFSTGISSPLPELPVQYADFAVWQRDWLQGDVLERQVEYWHAKLEGIRPLSLPTDHVRPSVQSFAGQCIAKTLDRELTRKLKQLSRNQGVTLYMTLLAAF